MIAVGDIVSDQTKAVLKNNNTLVNWSSIQIVLDSYPIL
jgi:hypothetical protein